MDTIREHLWKSLGRVAVVMIGIEAILIVVGLAFYNLSGHPWQEYFLKLGELTLQLGVIIVVGAFLTGMVNWWNAQQQRNLEDREKKLERQEEERQKKMDFLRRVRVAHITVESARELLIAHSSAKTYSEQMRRLMQLRFEVEEISEDLKASPGLFKGSEGIIEGLEGIARYLKDGRDEYMLHHADVDAGWQKQQTLQETIKLKNMDWVRDVLDSGKCYQEKYVQNLTKAKGAMRLGVFAEQEAHAV